MDKPLLKVEIKYEHDVVLARQRARQLAELLGFDNQDQVRIATAVSELARNAFQYASGGKVAFAFSDGKRDAMLVSVSDNGKGIAKLQEILSGNYQSPTGMGLGILGARRLMDDFNVRSDASGATVSIAKQRPKNARPFATDDIRRIMDALAAQADCDPFHEIQRQNQELLAALDEVQKQRGALTELNRELEETNRGVVALYAELDQRADYLRHASEMKTKFLSNMTHEFRTPLNSILSISHMLLQRLDGDLSPEQEKQVSFIQAGARSLSELVNDLLDLAKVEAGKVVIRPTQFEVSEMFRMLRGMLKPLLESNHSVTLVLEEPENIPPLISDEGKLSQILRNFISNGLKYTKRGEVRVCARREEDSVVFAVSDTGLGIPPEDHERIFEEFIQVEGDHQQKMKGTGLGLPLSRKLTELLGGQLRLESAPGMGSTFLLTLPLHYSGPEEVLYTGNSAEAGSSRHERILIIDDNAADRYMTRKHASGYAHVIVEAAGGAEGLALAESVRPSVIILDLVMPDLTGEMVLRKLKENPSTRHIPVIVHSSRLLSLKERQALLPKVAAIIPKGNPHQHLLYKALERLLSDSLRPQPAADKKLSYA